MALMSVERWVKKTSGVIADRKNPLITDIDILLREYHRPGKSDLQKLRLVVLIRYYCREWLSEKGGKAKSFRRKYVSDLLQETETEFKSQSLQAAINQRKGGGGRAMAGKQLEESMVEVLQPRGSAVQKFGLTGAIPLNRISGPNIEQEIDTWNMVHAGNQVDETDLMGVLDFVQDAKKRSGLQKNLVYLQKRERLSYRLQLWQDGLFHRAGQDFPHASPTNEHELYAMDDMELLYSANQPAKGGTFHHSSFLSGKPVLCAGELEIRNGKLLYIDNGSGHYRPNTQQLLNCLDVLDRRYGVDLVQVQIADHSQPQAQWSSAAQFKKFGGRPIKALPQLPAH